MIAAPLLVAHLPSTGRLRLVSARLGVLVGTLAFIVKHCDDAPLAAALDLLAIGLEDLQKALNELQRYACTADCRERLQRLLYALFNACTHFDRECVKWPELAGVLRLVTLAMNEVHDDLLDLLRNTETVENLQGTSSLHC